MTAVVFALGGELNSHQTAGLVLQEECGGAGQSTASTRFRNLKKRRISEVEGGTSEGGSRPGGSTKGTVRPRDPQEDGQPVNKIQKAHQGRATRPGGIQQKHEDQGFPKTEQRGTPSRPPTSKANSWRPVTEELQSVEPDKEGPN